MRQPLLDAVHGLDPARGEPDLDAEAMLVRIRTRAARGPDDVAHLVPAPRSRPAQRIALGAAAVLLVAVLAVGITLMQGGPQAYASWVATPAEVPVSQAAQSCPTTDPGPPGGPEIPLEPVHAEQRGGYTYTLLAGDGVLTQCLSGPPGEDFFSVAWGLALPDPAAMVPAGTATYAYSTGEAWPGDQAEGPVTTIAGVAAAEVTGITVSTTDGVVAEASVTDGWWSAWFPGEVEISDDLVITTPDGATTVSLGTLVP